MNDKDKEAFDDYVSYLSDYYFGNDDGKIHDMKVWKAAVEYKQKEIDIIQHQLDYSAKILTDVQADKQKLRSQAQELFESREKLWEENSRLKEQLGIY